MGRRDAIDILCGDANMMSLECDDSCTFCRHSVKKLEPCDHIICYCHHPSLPAEDHPEVDATLICDWYERRHPKLSYDARRERRHKATKEGTQP